MNAKKQKKDAFEEDYFDGYFKNGIGDYSRKRDEELSNWFRGFFTFLNRFVPLKTSQRKTILEFGCAYGAASAVLKDFGLQVTATDISKLAVTRAKKLHPGITYGVQDMQKPFNATKKFDYAIALDVIEHLEKPEKAIKNVYNILKKDGSAIFCTPNDYPNAYQDPTHISVKNWKAWKKICEEAGFSEVRIKRVTFFPPFLYRYNWRLNIGLPFPMASKFFLSTVFILAKK